MLVVTVISTKKIQKGVGLSENSKLCGFDVGNVLLIIMEVL